jgi:hypothetical protein
MTRLKLKPGNFLFAAAHGLEAGKNEPDGTEGNQDEQIIHLYDSIRKSVSTQYSCKSLARGGT